MGGLILGSLCLLSLVRLTPATFQPDAVLDFTKGNDPITGTLYFFRIPYGVVIQGVINGLKPGHHGFHVHQIPDLGNKCTNAGGHFNPFMKNHGAPSDRERHVGDLGNIFADHQGTAYLYIMDYQLSLDPHSKAYIGDKSIVVHEGQDDLGRGGNEDSLKTGNAGGRAGCGLIRHLHHGNYY